MSLLVELRRDLLGAVMATTDFPVDFPCVCDPLLSRRFSGELGDIARLHSQTWQYNHASVAISYIALLS